MEEPILSNKQITRRSFLQWGIFALGGVIAAVLGGSGLGYFISPAFKKRQEDWVDVGPVGDIAHGVPKKIEFVVRRRDAWVTTERRSSTWILTSNGQDYIAFDPKCTHLGCPYSWNNEKRRFLCPCHTAVFDVDGKVISGPPPRPLDRYPTKVVGGRLFILPKSTKGA